MIRWSNRRLALISAALTTLTCLGVPFLYFAHRARHWRAVDYEVSGGPLIAPDAEVGFAAAPRSACVRAEPAAGLRYQIFTDERGARVAGPGERTPAAVDLLTVGCSFSWGHGVEAGQTWTALLGRRLDIRTANLAFAGYGTTASLLLLRRHADLHPRVVVYGLIADHLRRNVMPCAPTYGPACLPAAWVQAAPDGSAAVVAPDLARYPFFARFSEAFFVDHGLGFRQVVTAAEADVRTALDPASDRRQDPAARQAAFRFLMGEMRETVQRMGARLIVAFLPTLDPDATQGPSDAVKQILAALPDVEVVDLTPVVARHYRAAAPVPLRFTHDPHPTAAAHELFAAGLEPRVRAALGR